MNVQWDTSLPPRPWASPSTVSSRQTAQAWSSSFPAPKMFKRWGIPHKQTKQTPNKSNLGKKGSLGKGSKCNDDRYGPHKSGY